MVITWLPTPDIGHYSLNYVPEWPEVTEKRAGELLCDFLLLPGLHYDFTQGLLGNRSTLLARRKRQDRRMDCGNQIKVISFS